MTGSGNNISPSDAADAWLRGIAQALRELKMTGGSQLKCVTFVENSRKRTQIIDIAIRRVLEHSALGVRYEPFLALQSLGPEVEGSVGEVSSRRGEKTLDENTERTGRATRVTVSRADDRWSFSAITETASIPERVIEMDPDLIVDSTNALAGQASLDAQIRYGSALEAFLIPRDLRDHFYGAAPLVMVVDSTTARVPWEMMVQPYSEIRYSKSEMGERGRESETFFQPDLFVGTSRGFTRQLRTQFSRPPQPSLAAHDTLRVLIVADPSAKHPLSGARSEGDEVLKLFTQLESLYSTNRRVEAKLMVGPLEASRLEVLAEITTRRYDILHFAGHCFFDKDDPSSSGWIFDSGILTARELKQIDTVPAFVFSNACESGVTPERLENYSAALAPSFAEAFFLQGVTNFICTAWPVDDAAAREFASRLYESLLGLERVSGGFARDVGGPSDMCTAVHRARTRIAEMPGGRGTWGAYQHYGDPFFRLYEPRELISRYRDVFNDGRGPARSDGVAALGAPEAAVFVTGGDNPADSSTTGASANPEKQEQETFERLERAVQQLAPDLLRDPQVVAVRPGYGVEGDWIAQEPSIVIDVLPGTSESLVQSLSQPLEAMIGRRRSSFPTSVVTASVSEQVLKLCVTTAERANAIAWLESEGADLSHIDDLQGRGAGLETRKATAKYLPPTDVKLQPVEEHMTITCGNSPSDSWSMLSEFFSGTKKRLVVAMYDFTAEHVLEGLKAAVKKKPRTLSLVLDPKTAAGAGDTETRFRDALREALGDRFSFNWAAVAVAGKTNGGLFNNSYHIKVAVRDGESFWLSSGNWQPQNQPEEDVEEVTTLAELRKTNREWHVVVENSTLSNVFERFIENDLSEATRFQSPTRLVGANMPFELLLPIEEETRAAGKAFPRRQFSRMMRITPLLTPDNYAEGISTLIASSRNSLYLQNQYLKPSPLFNRTGETAEEAMRKDRFRAICKAVRACVERGVDVRIILRRGGEDVQMLSDLKRFGIPPECIKLQDRCHNKGIVIDGQRVAVGSHNLSLDGATDNRDATIIIDDAEVAQYYAKLFLYDWNNLAKAKLARAPTVRRTDNSRGLSSVFTTVSNERKAEWSEIFR